MTKPKLTVTFGHSGHVVKRRDQFEGGNNVKLSSAGGKRSVRDRLGSNGESSSYSATKRERGGVDVLRPVKQIGKNDLRLKLLRKKKTLQVQRDAREMRKVDLRGPSGITRTVRIMPQHQSRLTEVSIPRHMSPPRNSDGSRVLESSRRTYPSLELGELRRRSPERMTRQTQDVLPPRILSHVREDLPLRSGDAFISPQLRNDDLLLNYRPTGPLSLPSRTVPVSLPSRTVPVSFQSRTVPASFQSRTVPESSQHVRPLPPSSSLIRPSLGEEPTTVSGLLQSLGLSKYYINFQAEEVDMPTLKQMGDIDLKEMGIPMGPRKKILLAINSRVTRRPA